MNDVAGVEGGGPPTVFVTDPSAEAERFANALRTAGYGVVDVPLSMLLSRVAVQRPRLLVVDADMEGALSTVARLREVGDSDAIDVLFVGREGGALASAEDAIMHDGSGFLPRPVDVEALLRKVEALTGGVQASASPPGVRRSSVPPPPPSLGSLTPGAGRFDAPELRTKAEPPLASTSPLSEELAQLLRKAEEEAKSVVYDSTPPSPDEEIEAVLPAELLRSLDEPLEDDEEDEEARALPVQQGLLTEAPGPDPGTQDGEVSRTTGGGTGAESTGASGNVGTEGLSLPRFRPPSEMPLFSPQKDEAPELPAEPDKPVVKEEPVFFAAPEAARLLAHAVARRHSGCLKFETEGIVRKVVFREGDLVTAASNDEDEALVPYLGVRGDLGREAVEHARSKFPPFGRHAGAALVARGYLRQEQLWPVLRAHAEWILARIMQSASGVLSEDEAPGRLRAEPSVFGGSTGAEVFVEVVRRVVPPEEAIAMLGGETTRMAEGEKFALLSECALSSREYEIVSRARGRTVSELLSLASETDLAPVLYALRLLDVLEAIPSVAPSAGMRAHPGIHDTIDEDAVRARVAARLELVRDGDYFSILGVPRDATGYEIRRAFLDLRRALEPERVLTPRLLDLEGDLRVIVSILEEAYDVLKDAARRDRYRRAIEA